MNILWFTWKDIMHPQAGGAESINHEFAKRLVQDKHKVTFIVAGYPNCRHDEMIEGYKVIRLGNKYTVYFKAYTYYQKYLSKWEDIVIEEINTFPFFTQWYTHGKRILYIFQLCREIWFYQMVFPFSIIGYLLEPLYLFLLRSNRVITESQSTIIDLKRYGFRSSNMQIVPVAIDGAFFRKAKIKKPRTFTLLSLGAIRPMKRTIDQIKAFELAKASIINLKLHIAGNANGKYGEKVIDYINNSSYADSIIYHRKVDNKTKLRLMRCSHLILVTSVKEGWGLIVTEAASQRTPAIVYNVDGLRDSVKHNITGIITSTNTVSGMAKAIVSLYNNKMRYNKIQRCALNDSQKYQYQLSYNIFHKVLKSTYETW